MASQDLSRIREAERRHRDPDGYRSGQTLLALAKNGVDGRMRVVGSLGRRPILRNVSQAEVEAFLLRSHSGVDRGEVGDGSACDCDGACATTAQPSASTPEVTQVATSERVTMDRAGYFVIIPDANRNVIVVEHYACDNQLQHVVEGSTSRDLYRTIIDAGWVSRLSHAAYLAAAELSLRHGFAYIQDAT